MGGTRLGERGGVGPPLLVVLPASSLSRREKSMELGSMGVIRITLSKALGCWDSSPISSGPSRSRGGLGGGGGLTNGGVAGSRVSKYPGVWGCSLSRGAAMRRRWNGLLVSPRKVGRGDLGSASAHGGGGRAIRGVREQLPGWLSK